MARYTCSYKFPVSKQQLYPIIEQIMESCELYIEFQNNDYIMIKEKKQDIYFSDLVNIDIIIDLKNTNEQQTTIDLIVKNDQLALTKQNHATQKLAEIQTIIKEKFTAELL